MGRLILNIALVLLISIANQAFNVLTIIKNWSLQGMSEFPMPKEFLLTDQLIRKEGFGVESHEVTTDDGHILPLWRIIPNRTISGNTKRIPILMVHGLWAASDIWVLRGKDRDLAYILTNMGYDVWLADMRGNFYAKRHKTLSSRDFSFWNFTFHEHGVHDLPAIVDFILNNTNALKIGYIGHSMGTTDFLVFASTRPEYNDKILGAVLLAPVGADFPIEELSNSLLRMALAQMDFLYKFTKQGELYEVMPRTAKMVHKTLEMCKSQPGIFYCLDVLGLAMGEHRENLDWTKCSQQMAHFPAGASMKTFHHLGQVFNNGLRFYDFGPKLNKLKYNTTKPPYYLIKLITAPVLLIHGENDPWTSSHGVEYLASRIPNAEIKLVEDKKFTHGDFVIGLNTNETMHEDILKFLTKYLPSGSLINKHV